MPNDEHQDILYMSLEYLKTQEEMFEYDHKTFSVCVLRLI